MSSVDGSSGSGPCRYGWMMSGSPRENRSGWTRSSTTASYPFATSASSSSRVAPIPARRIKCAIWEISVVDMLSSYNLIVIRDTTLTYTGIVAQV